MASSVRRLAPPLLLVARPIVRSDGAGTPRGTLIFARWLDAEVVDSFAAVLATPIEFLTPLDAPPGLIGRQAEDDATLSLRDQDGPVGYGVVRDITGQPAIVLRTSQGRAVSALATRTTVTLAGTVVVLGAVVTGAIVIALQATLLRPMSGSSERWR